MINNVTIGADPELFLERDGEIISAEKLIGGCKKNPKAISKNGHYILEDNIMAEFNIPPSSTKEDFVGNIKFVLDYLQLTAEVNDAKLNFQASADIDKKYLKTKQAREFGCMPDFNVYKRGENPRPSSKGTLRTCGGHIHIGYDNPSQEKSEEIVMAMDAVLGLKSLFIDKDDKRRSMYGNAGSFRFKPFGVEYRTLSNFWISSEELIGWAFEQTQMAIELINSGGLDKIRSFSSLIEKAINENDRELATVLLEKIKTITKRETTEV